MRALFFIGFILVAWSTGGVVTAGDEPTDELALGKAEILELVREKSTECRKEKDQSLCTNWFGKYGTFKRQMHADDARREGVWFVDDKDRLCILWQRKISPMCFTLYEQDDGTYNLYKNGKHISTLLSSEPGNVKDL
ncbi:MAG: hypothetical protein PVF93_05925 [Chromatiaceae bacterium]|jgi:hypothetical protein